MAKKLGTHKPRKLRIRLGTSQASHATHPGKVLGVRRHSANARRSASTSRRHA